LKIIRKDSVSVYYGVKVHAKRRPVDEIFYSERNSISNNDISQLTIKDPDGYSNNYADGIIFSGKKGKAKTTHIWLDEYTVKYNIKLKNGETLIDEGKNNSTV